MHWVGIISHKETQQKDTTGKKKLIYMDSALCRLLLCYINYISCVTLILSNSSLIVAARKNFSVGVACFKSPTPIMYVLLEHRRKWLQNFCMLFGLICTRPKRPSLLYCFVNSNCSKWPIFSYKYLLRVAPVRILKCSRVNIGRAWEGLHVASRVACHHRLCN